MGLLLHGHCRGSVHSNSEFLLSFKWQLIFWWWFGFVVWFELRKFLRGMWGRLELWELHNLAICNSLFDCMSCSWTGQQTYNKSKEFPWLLNPVCIRGEDLLLRGTRFFRNNAGAGRPRLISPLWKDTSVSKSRRSQLRKTHLQDLTESLLVLRCL